MFFFFMFSANASPTSQGKAAARKLVRDTSVDLTGSDRDTDKEGSLTDDGAPRRPVAHSMRRRAIHSANSDTVQPMNSSPTQTPRRSDTFVNVPDFVAGSHFLLLSLLLLLRHPVHSLFLNTKIEFGS